MVKPRKRKNETIDEYNERASKLYYSEGYHIKEIAKKLDIDDVEVYNYVVTRGRKITTSSEREEMIRLFDKGYSYSAIAKIFNRSRSCIKKRIESPAKITHTRCNDLTDKQIEKMKEMANNGEHIGTIAKELGIATSGVRYRLDHMGIHSTRTYVTQAEVKKFIKLYKQGKSQTEIAKICNRSRNAVINHLHAAGYYVRK